MKKLLNVILLCLVTLPVFAATGGIRYDTTTRRVEQTDLQQTFAAITNSAASGAGVAVYDAGKKLGTATTLAAIETLLGSINILAATELDSIAELETILGAVNVILGTEIDTLAELQTLMGGINIIAATEIDTEAEIEAIVAGLNFIISTEINTLAKIETLAAGVNIIQSTEIDTIAELETLLGSVNVILKTEIDTEAEFEALLFTLPEGGSGSNWAALVTTNSTLAGIAYAHQYVSTNGFESLGDGSTAGYDVFYDADGSNHGRFTAPTDITANWNVQWPATAGATGVQKQTVTGTNVVVTWAALVTGDLPAGNTLDAEWDTIAEIETATGVNILVSTEADTIAELETLLGAVNVILATEIDTIAELNTIITDANLVPEARTVTVAGTANEITSSTGAQDLSANRTWTLSLPSALTFTGKTITGGTYAFPDGIRQTFNPDGTVAGINVGSHTADPGTPINGDIWYDSVANLLRARVNGATISITGSAGGLASTDIDTLAELNSIVADADLARTDAANTFTGVQTMTAPVFVTKAQLPTAAGSSTLTTGGDAALNTTDKVLGIHNGTKEVGVGLVYHQVWTFDPDAVCDGAVDRLFLMTVGPDAPKGITVLRWNVSFEADPTTEVDLDLKRADAFIGVANSAVMDVLDTTAGASTEATAANINGGAVVAVNKILYLEFGTAYTESNHQIVFELWWELEED